MMKKVDATVIKETKYIALWVLVFSVLMEAVFLVAGIWDYTVLLGNLLGGLVAVLNFFLMGITVQSAIQKEEKAAKSTMKVSMLYRNLLILVSAILGVVLPFFNTYSSIIPLFFPRIAIFFRPFFDKKKS